MEIVAIDLYAAIRVWRKIMEFFNNKDLFQNQKISSYVYVRIFHIRDKCGKLGLLRQKDLSLYLFLFYSSSYLLFLTPLWDGRESLSISSSAQLTTSSVTLASDPALIGFTNLWRRFYISTYQHINISTHQDINISI